MTRWEWTGAHALSGGIIGGVAGGIAAAAPIGLIVVGTGGVIVSGADFIHTINIMKAETGITACTVTRLLVDVAGAVFGGVGIAKGVQAWRASGSGLRWLSPIVPTTGRAALNEMHAKSEPGSGWDVREVPGANAEKWFYRIADPQSVGPHPNPNIPGGLKGKVPGGGEIFYRPFTGSENPAIDISNVPGYTNYIKYHFPPR